MGRRESLQWHPTGGSERLHVPDEGYVVGPSGEQLTEVGWNPTNGYEWKHTNVYAAGKLIATYSFLDNKVHFHIDDPLGTRRGMASTSGTGVYQSLPFGDGYNSNAGDPTENHFTGKERDTESGNDYFGARYYASNMGRWMSPDWSAKEEPAAGGPGLNHLKTGAPCLASETWDYHGHVCQQDWFATNRLATFIS